MRARHPPNTVSRLLVTLLLMMIEGLCTYASAALLVTTSGRSVEKIPLPDAQPVHLLFWMEGEGKNELEGEGETDPGEEEEEEEAEAGRLKELETEEEDEGPLVLFKEEDEEEERRLTQEEEEEEAKEEEEEEEGIFLKTQEEEEKATAHKGDETGNVHLQGGEQEVKRTGEEGEVKEEGSVSLSYSVSSFQYPTVIFPLPRRNVWYSAHFDYNRVSIPVANIVKKPQPSSWWGRSVEVSSVSIVHWHLCPSPKPCEPECPTKLLQAKNTKPTASTDTSSDPSSDQGVGRMVVVALGAACGVLLPACLGLLTLSIMLWKKKSSQAPTQHPPHCSCRASSQL